MSSSQFYPFADLQRLGDEVQVRVEQALQVTEVSVDVDEFLVGHKPAFLELLTRKVHLIQSRSQAFEDGHVTVYDRALLELTQNGNDLERPAAIHFFLEEFLGLDPSHSLEGAEHIFQGTTAGDAMIHQDLAFRGAPNEAAQLEQDQTTRRTPGQKPDMEPQLARLWEVYEKAKAEHFATVTGNDSGKAVSTAKFLRDTAENTLQYLVNKNAAPDMMDELRATHKIAKIDVVSLTGGRKRKFDDVEMNRVAGIPRGPSQLGQQQRRSGEGGIHGRRPNPYQANRSGVRFSSNKNNDDDALARANVKYSPDDSDSGYGVEPKLDLDDARRRFSSADSPGYGHALRQQQDQIGLRVRGAASHGYNRGRSFGASTGGRARDAYCPTRGRGHSGIPFGYSLREVDSYVPEPRRGGNDSYVPGQIFADSYVPDYRRGGDFYVPGGQRRDLYDNEKDEGKN